MARLHGPFLLRVQGYVMVAICILHTELKKGIWALGESKNELGDICVSRTIRS